MSDNPNQIRYVHLSPEKYEELLKTGNINENYLYFVDNHAEEDKNKEDNESNE